MLPESLKSIKTKIYGRLDSDSEEGVKRLAEDIKNSIFQFLLKNSDKIKIAKSKNYEIDIDIKFGHLISNSELFKDPNYQGISMVKLERSEKSNKSYFLFPGIEFIFENKGEDLEIKSVILSFGSPKRVSEDDLVNNIESIDITSLHIGKKPVFNRNFKCNTSQSITLDPRFKQFILLIIKRGLESLIVKDVIGNCYELRQERIQALHDFLEYYYSQDEDWMNIDVKS